MSKWDELSAHCDKCEIAGVDVEISPVSLRDLITENEMLRRAIRNSIDCDFHEIARDMLIGQAKSHDLYAACERLQAAIGEEMIHG